jgi:hypothetical protein
MRKADVWNRDARKPEVLTPEKDNSRTQAESHQTRPATSIYAGPTDRVGQFSKDSVPGL